MIRARIHIETESEIFDEDVFIDCYLPSTPRTGDILHLNRYSERRLEELAFSSKSKEDYFEQYKYNRDPGISFMDCVEVKFVRYVPNDPIVYISIGRTD